MTLVKCGQAEKVKLTQMLTFCTAQTLRNARHSLSFPFRLWTYSHQCQSCMFGAEQYVAKTFVKRCYLHLLLRVGTPRCRLTSWKSGNPRQALERRRLKAWGGIPKYLHRVYIMEHCQTVHWKRGQRMQILAIPRIPRLLKRWKHIWSVSICSTHLI